jgi:hypothetical protein
MLHVIPKIKRPGGGIWPAGRGYGVVCSKGAISVFILGRNANDIAARSAGKLRGNGRAGKPKRDTGIRRRADRNETDKASATESASRADNPQIQRRLVRPRG